MKRIAVLITAGVLALAVIIGCGQQETASGNNAENNIEDKTENIIEDKTESKTEDKAEKKVDDITESSNADATGSEATGENEDLTESSEITESDAIPDTDVTLEPESEDHKVTITMVGDVLLHEPVEKSAQKDDGTYDFSAIFDNVKEEISAADVAIANQEVIIGGEELGISGYPCFNAPFEIADELVDAGFDVVCHGTNHVLDKGKQGIINAINYWKETYPDITVLGINESEEEKNEVKIIEVNGIKIALLNYTYGTNGIDIPSDMPYAVDMMEEEKVVSDLHYAEENADFTVVCPHWGTEYNLGTDSYQQYWTNIFRKNGADLVIGTHPHVIEPVEMIEDDTPGISNNRGDGDMLIYYSIGNFVSWTSSTGHGVTNRMVGGMPKVTIDIDENGEAFVSDYMVEAVVCHLTDGFGGVTVYPLKEYTDEMGKENAIVSQDPEFSTQACKNLCKEVWGEDWE